MRNAERALQLFQMRQLRPCGTLMFGRATGCRRATEKSAAPVNGAACSETSLHTMDFKLSWQHQNIQWRRDGTVVPSHAALADRKCLTKPKLVDESKE